MNDTIYRGMRVLVYVALGKTAYSNDSEYLKLKNHFRYPGEVLERMEQYGYSSDDDYMDQSPRKAPAQVPAESIQKAVRPKHPQGVEELGEGTCEGGKGAA